MIRPARPLPALLVVVVLAATTPAAGQTERPSASPAEVKEATPAETAIVIDRVVAIVDDDIILASELARRVLPLTAELEDIGDTSERERRQSALAGRVLDEMVDEELVLSAAAEAKLEVSEQEVRNALEEIKKQNNVDDDGLAKALEMQGYTLSSYRADVRRQILRMRAVNVLVRPRVTVTDEDVRAAYDARNRRSGAVNKVYLHHVLIALPANPSQAQVATAKQRAATAIERARGGEAFAEVARELSDDEGTSGDGGNLGWIERGSLPTEWEAIVFSMSKGEVRGPISGPSGLHVFYVSELEQAEQEPFDQVKEKIRNDLYRQQMDKQTSLWLEELRTKAHVELKL